MDSLLRAHTRRERSARATATAAQASAHAAAGVHLDADELSAYAENALPASARTRFSAHLADCDSCREQVVVLARAAGVADQLEQRAAHAHELTLAVSWRERLAALFTSSTWRYAMPVVALVFVSGIVLLLMTGTRKGPESANQIASASRPNEAPQFDHAEAARQADELPTNSAAPPSAANANANINNDSKSPAAPAPTPASGDLLARNEPAEKAGAPAGSVAPQMAKSAESATATQNAEPVQTQSTNLYTVPQNANAGAGLSSNQMTPQTTPGEYAPAPPSASGGLAKSEATQTQSKAANENNTTTAEQPRKRAADLDDRERNARRGRDEQRSDEDETRLHGPSRSLAAPKPRAAVENKDKQAEKETNDARRQSDAPADRATTPEAGETRNVGGRKFRRQNGAWVDTAYKSGQATVNVRRDSEQWRALIADEPSVRRIADALGGEVVIVWKGRAYRIKP